MSERDFTEFGLISEIKKWVADNKLIVPIGDDAAAFKSSFNKTTLFTADSLIEDVHFKLDDRPDWLGYKSLAVNISDIAAMGGTATYATVSLGLPAKIGLDFMKIFYQGLKKAADEYALTIVGGDLSSSKELIISIALLGEADEDKIMRRDQAKPGDKLLVTGTLGASAAGLRMALDSDIENESLLLEKHLKPVAKIEQGKLAAELGVKTAIDVSDGLISDCQRICEASKVGCSVNAVDVPISDEVIDFSQKHDIDPLELAVSGGEDYELIFCARPSLADKLLADFETKHWPLTKIGEVTTGSNIELLGADSSVIDTKKGYEHFVNGG